MKQNEIPSVVSQAMPPTKSFLPQKKNQQLLLILQTSLVFVFKRSIQEGFDCSSENQPTNPQDKNKLSPPFCKKEKNATARTTITIKQKIEF